MPKLTCDIVTPEAKCFTDEAFMVVVPGTEGQMGFLYDHVPLVSALADGVADAEDEGGVDDADEDGPALAEGSDVGAVDTKVIILADKAQERTA